MSLFVASLNSGSNGNCYYIGNQDEAVLIDGGISCRETEKRMKRLGLSIKKVKAVFVSHEHGDHIHGVASLSKKHQLPVYITSDTLRHGKLNIREDRIFTLTADTDFQVGNLTVRAFPKFHDASDPYSFMVSSTTVNVGIFTDIGRPCENVIRYFRLCHAAFLESNYDEDMLENGGYPLALKNRIRGGNGHLSNRQAVELFMEHRSVFMSHLFLSNLSRNNNKPKIVKDLFSKVAGQTKIIVASREKETELYHIRDVSGYPESRYRTKAFYSKQQLSLFH